MGNGGNAAKPRLPYYNYLGVASILFLAILVIVYFVVRRPTVDLLWSDFLVFLPYLIVGGISFVLGFLDLFDKFADLGTQLPLSNRYGWSYLLLNTTVPMALLYGYLNYFPSLGVPKIGDQWLTSFVVALAFPLLIRSKFFSYTNSSGDKVSVGFDQLYDRLVEFFVREILRSTKAQEMRHDLVKKCAELFTDLKELEQEAYLLVLNHMDWQDDRKNKANDNIKKIIDSTDKDFMKKLKLADYILTTNGEDYLKRIMLDKAPADKVNITELVEKYKQTLGRTLPLILRGPL
jgi:hypothetical protein